jgi:hypothetical protein
MSIILFTIILSFRQKGKGGRINYANLMRHQTGQAHVDHKVTIQSDFLEGASKKLTISPD